MHFSSAVSVRMVRGHRPACAPAAHAFFFFFFFLGAFLVHFWSAFFARRHGPSAGRSVAADAASHASLAADGAAGGSAGGGLAIVSDAADVARRVASAAAACREDGPAVAARLAHDGAAACSHSRHGSCSSGNTDRGRGDVHCAVLCWRRGPRRLAARALLCAEQGAQQPALRRVHLPRVSLAVHFF